jgi:hypothetical protein
MSLTRRISYLCCVWGLMLFSPTISLAQLNTYGLSAEQLSEIQKGEVVVVKLPPPGNAGVKFRALKKMPIAGAKLKPVFVECEHFKKFMPRTLSSAVSKKTAQTATCEVVVDMPFPFDDLESTVDTKWGDTKPGVWSRSWSLVRGSFNRNRGSWTVIDTEDPNQSIVVYEASVDPKVSIPDFILRAAQVNTIPDLMMAILKRAQSI